MLDAPREDELGSLIASIPAADHAPRRARLAQVLREQAENSEGPQPEALLVTNLRDVRWLTGLVSTSARVLVHRDGRCQLVTDGRYAGAAHGLAEDDLEVVINRAWVQVLETLLDAAAVTILAVQEHEISLSDGQLLTQRLQRPLVGVGELVMELRSVKDTHEVACLRAANHVTVAAMQRVLGGDLRAVTERALALRLERAFVDLGADGVAFRSIVAFGENSAIPHHHPTDRPLGRGELIKMDVGALVRGYHADVTRTVAHGAVPASLIEVHAIVQRAQIAGRTAVAVGADAVAVDTVCREIITDAGYGERFAHGTGHGTGLDIHELPRVQQGPSATLRAGSVLTVEPGIYLPGIGGVRIEDSILVTPDGPDILSPARRDLVVL